MNDYLKPNKLAFVRCSKKGLDFWENTKGEVSNSLKAAETIYVSISDLNEAAKNFNFKHHCDLFPSSIWAGTVGFMCNSWVNKSTKNYRFGTGSYTSSVSLLLMDDVFEWAHRRISSDKVRSAWDIIKEIHKSGK